MDGIQLMMEEHDNILTVLSAIRKHSVQVMEGAALCTEDFRDMIHFARSYADKHHHGKEEKLLFNEMEARLGSAGEKLIRNGMLVEHDLGRLHIAELEKALNQYEQDPSAENRLAILAEAYGYAALLRRHIDKENQVVYPFAERGLEPQLLREIGQRVADFEEREQKAREDGLALLEKFRNKYLS